MEGEEAKIAKKWAAVPNTAISGTNIQQKLAKWN